MGNSPSSQQRHLSQQQQPRAPLSDEELRQRQQRADALEQKAAKVKRKDPEQVKAEHWRSYAEIDAQQNAKTGTAPTLTGTVASLGSMSLSSSSSVSSSSSSPSPAQPSTFTSAISTTPSSLITVAPPPHVPTAVSPAPSRVPLDPREARTRLLENKVSRFKLTVGARNRKSQWEAWKELDQATRVKQSGSNTNLAGAEAAASSAAPTLFSRDSFTPPAQGSPTAASSSSSLASARSVLAQIPTTSLQLLLRIVDNVINAGHVDTPEANKVRRIRLSNPKIADAIVDVDGCVELLLMCGFTLRSETIDAADEEETVFWFDPLTALDDCRECAALLRSVLASR